MQTDINALTQEYWAKNGPYKPKPSEVESPGGSLISSLIAIPVGLLLLAAGPLGWLALAALAMNWGQSES